jgi:hypothetical protein
MAWKERRRESGTAALLIETMKEIMGKVLRLEEKRKV